MLLWNVYILVEIDGETSGSICKMSRISKQAVLCVRAQTNTLLFNGWSWPLIPPPPLFRSKYNSHQLKKVWGPNHGHGYKLCIRICLCTAFVFWFWFVFVFSPIEESLHATNHQGAGLAKATHPSPWAEPQWQISTNIDLKLSAGFYRARWQLSKDNLKKC